jgi:hypothetical protein
VIGSFLSSHPNAQLLSPSSTWIHSPTLSIPEQLKDEALVNTLVQNIGSEHYFAMAVEFLSGDEQKVCFFLLSSI